MRKTDETRRKMEQVCPLFFHFAITNSWTYYRSQVPGKKLRQVPQQKPKFTFVELFTPSLRMVTLLLWVIWFCNTFVYYGLLLLSPSLFDEAEHEDPNKKIENPRIYFDVFITSCAEFPGLFISALLVDRLGRKKSQAAMFAACGIFTLLFVRNM